MTAPLSLIRLVLFLPTLAAGLLAQAPAQDRDAGWRADLAFFAEEARRVHADPERPAYGEAFAAAVRDLDRDIPELTDDQVLARMMKIAAILNDGHTALFGPGPNSRLDFERRVLPFKFYLFPSGVYIVGGHEEWADYAGNRVVRFGSVPAEQVLERLAAYRGVDNEMTWNWLGPQFYLRQLSMLQEVGVEVDDGVVELTLSEMEGEEEPLTIEGGDFPVVRKLRPFPLRDGEPPLYLQKVSTNYWMQPLPEHDALYFQFNAVEEIVGDPIAKFAERLRQALRDQGNDLLIVDVRHNNGGNNTLLLPLMRVLIEWEMRDPSHRIHVLTSRNTFSACQNFINRIEAWTDARFFGEPSSSSPNFIGESNEIELPFSRVQGSISCYRWQDSLPWDTRQWIAPDVSVALTVDHYMAGVDPVLARALER